MTKLERKFLQTMMGPWLGVTSDRIAWGGKMFAHYHPAQPIIDAFTAISKAAGAMTCLVARLDEGHGEQMDQIGPEMAEARRRVEEANRRFDEMVVAFLNNPNVGSAPVSKSKPAGTATTPRRRKKTGADGQGIGTAAIGVSSEDHLRQPLNGQHPGDRAEI